MNVKNKSNEYLEAMGRELFNSCPKSVFAAIAVSALTVGGDYLAEARERVLEEWWILYGNGIVPQKPPPPRPSEAIPK